MTENINVKINVDSAAAGKSVKEVRMEMFNLAEEMQKAAKNGDKLKLKELSKEFDALSGSLDGTTTNTTELVAATDKLVDTLGDVNRAQEQAAISAQDQADAQREATERMMADFGQLVGGISGVAGAITLLGSEGDESLVELQEKMNKTIGIVMGLRGAVEAGMGAMKLWVPVQKALNAAMAANPVGVYVAAIAALSAAIYLVIRATDQQAKTQRELNKAYEEASTEIGTQKRKLDELLTTARDNTATLQERQSAMEEINKISPEFLGNLTLETIGTRGATDAMTLYIEEMANKAKAQALNALLVEKYIKLEEQYNNNDNIRNITKTKDAIYELEKEYKKLVTDVDVFSRVTKGTSTSITDLIGTTQVGVPEGTEAINFDGTPIIYKNGKWEAVVVKPKGNSSSTTKASVDNWKTVADDTVEVTVSQFDRMYRAQLDYLKKQRAAIKDNSKFIESMDDKELDDYLKKKAARKKWDLETIEEIRNQSFVELRMDFEDKLLTEEEYLKKRSELRKKYEDEDNRLRLENTQKQIDNQKYVSDALGNILQASMDVELANAEGNEEEQKKIRKKYAASQATVSLAQVAINTAEGVTKATAQTGVLAPLAIPLVIAQGIAQSSLIAAQAANISKAARGGVLVGPSHANGGIYAGGVELEGREGIINKNSMADPVLANIASAVNVAGGGVPLTSGSSQIIDYDLLAGKLAAAVNDKKVYVVESDISKSQKKVSVIESKTKF